MPLFLIRRDVPGATQTDIDGASFRAIQCAFDYENLKWHRSYWDREASRTFCIYEAESRDQILSHSERSRIPCDEIILVQEIRPGDYAGEPIAAHAAGNSPADELP